MREGLGKGSKVLTDFLLPHADWSAPSQPATAASRETPRSSAKLAAVANVSVVSPNGDIHTSRGEMPSP